LPSTSTSSSRAKTIWRRYSQVRDALAKVDDAAALGPRWSNVLRANRIAANDCAKAAGVQGRDPPPLDVERLRPYFVGLARDVVELGRIPKATERNLYLHVWPD